ncbi:MAG: ATP-binding cassette domain-containing protein [Gammaproteobacteria bacterium]|nr:ATP-binding cassette domain-containing protein [Gammaproteobacteria bacterium]
MKPLIRAIGLSRYFGNTCALNNLTLELYPGEVLGLLGPNGAGKSTTLRILSGSLAATSGQVDIDGTNLQEHPNEAKRKLGYLPDTPPLYPELKVDEYLRFCAALRSVPSTSLVDAIARAKLRTGLMEQGTRLIGQLSKGYQQRVGIAQAIIHDPRVVILDEPTSGLDPNQLIEIRRLIRELGHLHGVILSSHILPEIQSVCSRVMILHDGRPVYSDTLGSGEPATQTWFWVGFGNPPTLEALAALPGVSKIIDQQGNRFCVETDDALEPEELSKQIVARGWGLRELTPVQQSLEQIFTRLTCGEAAS